MISSLFTFLSAPRQCVKLHYDTTQQTTKKATLTSKNKTKNEAIIQIRGAGRSGSPARIKFFESFGGEGGGLSHDLKNDFVKRNYVHTALKIDKFDFNFI